MGRKFKRSWPKELLELLLEAIDIKKCQKCGKSDVPLTVHHIVSLAKGGKNVLSNVEILCRECHNHRFGSTKENKRERMRKYMRWYWKTHPEQYKKLLERNKQYHRRLPHERKLAYQRKHALKSSEAFI